MTMETSIYRSLEEIAMATELEIVGKTNGKTNGKTKSHDWEWCSHTTYKNGDDWGMVCYLLLLYPQYGSNITFYNFIESNPYLGNSDLVMS